MKYAEYKDSSVDWIGKVPIHWNIMRGKFIVKVLPGYAFDSKKFTSDEGISLIRIRDINNTSTEMNYYGSFNEEYIVNTGDVLVGMDGDFNVAKWKGERALLNQRVCKIVGTNIMLSSYMYYLLSRPLKLINDVCYATTVKHLSTSDIENSLFPVPTIQEQHAIVAYLNEKCNKIDGAIDVQKKKIDLLNELKQTIITNAVTKGLNPNAPMKDSGVELIGQVPEHWEVKRLKFNSKFINGFAFKSDSFSDDGEYPVIRIGDIYNDGISYDNIVYVPLNSDLDNYKVRNNDILIAMSGATVGKVGLCNSNDGGYINQRVGIVRSEIYKLIWYNLLSPKFLEYIYLMSDGSAQPNISSKVIRDYYIAIPSHEEQQEIIEYLTKEVSKIDAQISKANRRIELLNEFKQSVITEAVTGKIKVC